MKPVQQTNISDKNGDCWRASIASILEKDIDALPAPEKFGGYMSIKYLKALNSSLCNLGYYIDNYKVTAKSGDLLSPDTNGYIMAVGDSTRKIGTHVVVWKDGIAYDPHPDKLGISCIRAFQILRKI